MYFLAWDTSSVIINEILVNAVVINIKMVANAGDADSIPGLGSAPEKAVATHSSILAWRIP